MHPLESQVRGILGEVFSVVSNSILKATWEQDCKEATDYILPDGRTVGCRIRRHDIFRRFPHQFVLRCRCPSGAKTELEKVLEGYCDLYLYSFLNEVGVEIISWFIGDMSVFRDEWERFPLLLYYEELPPDKHWQARTGRAFWLKCFPPEFIVAYFNHPTAEWVQSKPGTVKVTRGMRRMGVRIRTRAEA